jgi:FkbM family methyltransferase
MKLSQKLIEKLNISGKISQSYYGEDIMLWRYFKQRGVCNGFFIDVGAYHPKFCNNTWRLRKKLGFRGINIEPTDRIDLFRIYRRNDINIKCLVGENTGWEIFNYVSNEPGVSGKDKDKLVQEPDRCEMVRQKTLTQIVSEFDVTHIDLLDIDIEGTEMEVLKGYDWKIRPHLILIEHDKDIENKIFWYLTNRDYKLIGTTLNNAIYERS